MQFKISYASLNNLFEVFIIYLCLFPYVSFGLNRLDSQPGAIFFVIIYVFFKLRVEKKDLFILWMISILLILFSLPLALNNIKQPFELMALVRAIANYSSVFFLWGFSIMIHKKINPLKHYLIASWIYNIYGLMQSLGFGYFDWATPNRTGIARGVTSFAAEPTYYGILLFFLIWIIWNSFSKIENGEIKKKYTKLVYLSIFVNVLSIFLLAKSSMAILYIFILLIFLILLFLNRKLVYYLSILILLTSSFIYFNIEQLNEYRFISLFNQIKDSSLSTIYLIVYNDESINGRVGQVVFPILGLINNIGLPGGFQTFNEMVPVLYEQTDHFFYGVTHTNKIQSFPGVFIYELGAVGLFFIIYMGKILYLENNWKYREIFLLLIFLTPCVPLGLGIIPLLFGSKLSCYKVRSNQI